MGDVLLATVPLILAAVWIFGIGVLLVISASVAGAVGTEWIFTRSRKQSPLLDNSALLTGVLLGLVLPPGFPLWMAALEGSRPSDTNVLRSSRILRLVSSSD